jgi:hypothetical protein
MSGIYFRCIKDVLRAENLKKYEKMRSRVLRALRKQPNASLTRKLPRERIRKGPIDLRRRRIAREPCLDEMPISGAPPPVFVGAQPGSTANPSKSALAGKLSGQGR